MSERENVLRRVQAMLDKAASTEFAGERDTFLAKADEMMARFAIEEFELAQRDGTRQLSRAEARWVALHADGLQAPYEVRVSLVNMMSFLVDLVGCRLGSYRYQDGERQVHVVGYPADLDYLQMLYINLQMHFLSTVTPKRDESLTDLQNYTRMRDAGMSTRDIWAAMGWTWEESYNERNGQTHPSGATATLYRKLRKGYQELCRAEGREPVRKAAKEGYFISFVQGYVGRIGQRILEMKQAREAASQGHELVLAGRANDLDEALWDLYPDRRPHPADCECDTCHFAKCKDKACTRPRCQQYWANYNKPVRYRAPRTLMGDANARAAGASVANRADLGGTGVKGGGEAIG